MSLRSFLRGCGVEWGTRDLSAALQKLSRVVVRETGDLLERIQLGILNEQLEEAGERKFADKTLELVAVAGARLSAALAPSVTQQTLGVHGRNELHEELPHTVKQTVVQQDVRQYTLESPETSHDLECAICFEPVLQATKLPCACKVDYCMQCWDRAMARSFQKCNLSRCPTCRSPVRVDYEFSQDCLVFSKELDAPQGDDSEDGQQEAMDYFDRTLERLTEQVRPKQVLLLRQHGEPAESNLKCPLQRYVLELAMSLLLHRDALALTKHVMSQGASVVVHFAA